MDAPSHRPRFKTPAERNRTMVLAYGLAAILFFPIGARVLPRWAFFGLQPIILMCGAAAGWFFFRRAQDSLQARQSREQTWGYWPDDCWVPPSNQRTAHVIKAGRFYVVAFTNSTLQISPRLDSRRKAEKWADSYVSDASVDMGHSIAFDEIEALIINEPANVEVVTAQTIYTLDSWFNSYSGSHHAALRGVAENLDLTPIDDDSNRIQLARTGAVGSNAGGHEHDGPTATRVRRFRKTTGQERVSCGGGANMFDPQGQGGAVR